MKRIYSLDVLRIIATIFIILHHYQQITNIYFEGALNFYNGIFDFGNLVEFFFVLSGFLTFKYIGYKEMTFEEFYLPKIKRLLPLVLVSCITYVSFQWWYERLGNGFWILGPGINLWNVIISGLGIRCAWCYDGILVNNPVWYVSSLLLCYAIFYLLVYISRKNNFNVVYSFGIMIFLGSAICEYQWNLPFLNEQAARGYYAFFFGLILAYILHEKKITWKSLIVSLLLVIGMTYGIVNYYHYFQNGIRYLMTFIYYPALIVLFLGEPVKRIFRCRFIGTLGEITYDMYIWHTPMLILLHIITTMEKGLIDIYNRTTMFVFCGAMIIVGIISHYLIERPIQRKLKNVKKM